MKRKQSQRIGVVISLLLSFGLLAACTPGTVIPVAASPPALTATPATAAFPAPTEGSGQSFLTALDQSLESIYTQVDPSVVNIHVVKMVDVQSSLGFPLTPFNIPQSPQKEEGTGSGFVWNKDGFIVTNDHVVQDATEISVTFSDGVTLPAELVGADPDSDLAVISVDRPQEQLHPVQVASSAALKVGQLAVAIGNPFGLQGSMTMGVISALGRTLPSNSDTTEGSNYTIPAVIQTDAPINPGNSGGVLVDDQGFVIGVTSAIVSQSGSSAGIGFAIPSDIVEKVVPHLINDGVFEHPYIGISGRSLDSELDAAMNLPGSQFGALVIDVTPGGPADKVGLRGSQRTATIDDTEVPIGGDVITSINGNPVKSFDDLVAYLALNTEVGDTIELEILRDGQTRSIQLTLEPRPEGSEQIALNQADTGAYLGILGIPVTPEIAQALDLPSDLKGILIERVVTNSPADQAGLRGSYISLQLQGQEILVGGDIITSVEKQPVATMENLQDMLGQLRPDQQATLTILRDGETMNMIVTLGARPS